MLSTESLSISFSGKPAIENLHIRLKEKQRLALIGGNGSGKTTLALFLASVIPEFIEAKVSGKAVLPEKASLIMQNPSSQFFSMTVEEELKGAKTKGFNVGPLLSKNVFELSEGEKQKINLVSNLSFKPELVLLDEPLELLDPLEAKRFLGVIEKISDSSIIWFDKGTEFVERFDKKYLTKQEKTVFPEKKKRGFGEKVLEASFSLQKNGFALYDIKISLRKGEKIAFIGCNGSGKTTLLKALAGLEKIDGTLCKKMPLSLAPQNPSYIFFQETVDKEVRCAGNLEKLGINPLLQRDPATLSKGQQKLVSIAATEPRTIALLDEPTTWLDNGNKAAVYDFINNSEQAMVIATHDRKLLDYCDRVLLIEKNKVRECSSTAVNRFFLK